MKVMNRLAAFAIAAAVTISTSAVAFAQTEDDSANKTRQRTATKTTTQDKKKPAAQKPVLPGTGERLEPDDTATVPTDVPEEAQANRREQISEESAVVPYYNNFFNSYRLGPEDVISVTVFGQDRYSRGGIIIPPSGRIALALIPGGIFVNGKTVEEVSELVKKQYDEYIIDPQVTVSLDKGFSYRYAVVGDVAQPGIRLMSHRMTVTEALNEAGGVLPTGNKSKIVVLRRQTTGYLAPIAVNVSQIYKGRVADDTYLVPGDQIIVPGNKWKTLQKIMGLTPIMSFARIFTGGALPF
ncbi:MAG: polysaccharide biosynthesis/export family protein [Acidobacteriota bacterium]